MSSIRLSAKAKSVINKLVSSKDSDNKGYIAALDSANGEYFLGKTIVDASKKGRIARNNPKAIFHFIRIGYPSVDVLKNVRLQGKIIEHYLPKIYANNI
ncbi:MAG: hypothetical protein FVQ77_06740 [Cytophagales bacterium]|nr:hypothetical protein [Cytophagales bacterium]MBW8050025.1 hypothetical protein [Cytophagales bacterium]